MHQLAEFWDRFAAEHWERRPGVFPRPPGEALLSCARAFECAVDASTRWRRREPASLRVFIENGLVQSNLDEYLPRPGDADFRAYAQRIAPRLGGQGFAFVLNGAAQYDFGLFLRARGFLSGLYERVGVPADVTDMDLFVGNYRHTPFGVHTDKASNFSLVLSGRKKFLLWPWPALQTRYDVHRSLDFESVRSDALVLEAEAGEMVYWPSSYWHIAESEGDLSAVLNIALYLEDTTRAFVESAILEPRHAPAAELKTLPWDSAARGESELPAHLQRTLQAASTPRASKPSPGGALLRAWLSRTSAHNFHRSYPPAATPERPHPDMQLKIYPDFPILTRLEGEQLLCAAHGHVIELPALPGVVRLIERLNAGHAQPVTELIGIACGSAQVGGQAIAVGPDDVLLLLENLLAMRAIQVAAGAR